MALIVKTTTAFGLSVDNAYCRIEGVSIAKDGGMTFTLCRYVAQGTQFPSFGNTQFTTSYTLTGANPVQQAYEYLKTLPEFANATDVLEAGQTA